MDSHWTRAVHGTTETGGKDIRVVGSRFRERRRQEAHSASDQEQYRRPCTRPDTTAVVVVLSLHTTRTSASLPSSISNSNSCHQVLVQDSQDIRPKDMCLCTRAPRLLHRVVLDPFFCHLLRIITTPIPSLTTQELHNTQCTQMLWVPVSFTA